MRKLILSKGWYITTLLILVVLGGLQLGANFVIQERTEVYRGECQFISEVSVPWWSSGIKLPLNCGGILATMDSREVTASFLNNPGPLSCKVTANSIAYCEPRERNTS